MNQRAIKFKLLLEGIVTPFVEISVTDAINITSSASIVIPFSLAGKFIRPKTSVLVFYKYEDVKDMAYQLFFFGEVVGRVVTRRGDSRAIQLQCLSLSNYLDHSYISFSVPGSLGDNVNLGSASGGAVVLYNNLTTSSAFKEMLTGKLDGYIRKLLQALWHSEMVPNIYLSKFKAFSLEDKFQVLPLDVVDNFIKAVEAPESSLKQQIVGNLHNFSTFAEHLASVKSLLLLDYVENRSLAKQNFLFKPILNYGIPPRCNVIFPCHYENFTLSEDFYNAPTRLFYTIPSPMVKNPMSEKLEAVKVLGLSPYELKEGFIKSREGGRTSHNLYYTAEESERGIVPYFGSEQDLDNIWFMAMRGHTSKETSNQTTADADYEFRLQQWQDFKLFYLRAKFKKLDLSDCVFMPQLMCGFPAVVADPQGFYIGYLESVTHSISAAGRATTRMNLTSVRDMIDPVPGRPWWFKDFMGKESSYGVENIDEKIYKPYLGCLSMLETDEFIKEVEDAAEEPDKSLFKETMIGILHPSDITENWQKLSAGQQVGGSVYEDTKQLQWKLFKSLVSRFLLYSRSTKKYMYAEDYTKRMASSFEDFVKLYGAIKIPEASQQAFDAGEIVDLDSENKIESIAGRDIPVIFFKQINQEVIREYRNSLSKINVDTFLYGRATALSKFPGEFASSDQKEISALTTAPDSATYLAGDGKFEVIRSAAPQYFPEGPPTGTKTSNFATNYSNSVFSDKIVPFTADNKDIICSPIEPGKYYISSDFLKQRAGYRHHGIDMAAPEGTPVYAARGGTVRKKIQGTGINTGYGRYVEIEHEDGTSTVYAHLSAWNNIPNGTKVGAGTRVGAVGNTGRSSGNHLHFEHKKTGSFGADRVVYNPMRFINK